MWAEHMVRPSESFKKQMSAKTSKVQLFVSMLSAWKEPSYLPQWKKGEHLQLFHFSSCIQWNGRKINVWVGTKRQRGGKSIWKTGVKSCGREEIFNGRTCNKKEKNSKM